MASTVMPSGRTRRWWVIRIAILALAIGLTGAATHVVVVRYQYGVWSWSPGKATPTIPFGGRTYLRGSTKNSLTPGFVHLGRASGGEIFGPPPTVGVTATGLEIRYADGSIIGYGLSGGP